MIRTNHIIFLICLLLATSILPVGAYSVGVKKDNYVKWNLDNNIPLLDQTIHQTGWVKITVLSIDGDRITATYDSHFDPGVYEVTPIDEKVTGYIDVSTGESDFPLSSTPIVGRATGGLIIPAGLSDSDDIPGIGNIQGTETHDGRKAIYTVVPGVGTSIETWWDQETGVLLETHFAFPYGSVTGSRTFKLAETDVWGGGFAPPDWWFWMAVVFVMAIIVAAATVMLRRRKSAVTLSVIGFSYIFGVILAGLVGQFGGWFMSNFSRSGGQMLAAVLGGWWLTGFALITGLIMAIATSFMVLALEKGFRAKLIEAGTSVTVGILVTLLVGSLIMFPIYSFFQATTPSWNIITIPLVAAGIIIPFIVGGYAAAFMLAIVDGIIETRSTPKQETKETRKEKPPEYTR